MRDEEATTKLHDALGEFVLGDDARARLRHRLDSYTAANERRPAKRRRHRLAWGAAALTGAAALLLIVALGPSGSGSRGRHDAAAAHRSSRAVLLSAAQAAGSAQWRPLAHDEYHHVYSTSFYP
jgi:ferric-dicitrate binding protein FerR (iron transport regulator)